MTESTSRSIPLQVLQGDTPSAPLQAGAKQLGGDKINRSPVQFADAPVLRNFDAFYYAVMAAAQPN